MQSTIDSVDLQMLSAHEFNKLPALVRTELLASGKLGVEVRRRSRLVSGVGTNDAGILYQLTYKASWLCVLHILHGNIC